MQTLMYIVCVYESVFLTRGETYSRGRGGEGERGERGLKEKRQPRDRYVPKTHMSSTCFGFNKINVIGVISLLVIVSL